MPGKDDDHVSLGNIMDKLCHLESRMEDLFGSLKSELSCLRHELNEEIEKVKSTVNDMETSLNAAWDTIKDLQDELKIHAEFRKKHKESLEKHLEDNGVSQSAKAKIALQESQINLLNTKLSEEQEKIIALENYSRRENLRFMNILEQQHENCTDTIYDIVENDCGHQNGASQLFLVVFLARDFNLVLDVQNDKKGGRLTTHKNSL